MGQVSTRYLQPDSGGDASPGSGHLPPSASHHILELNRRHDPTRAPQTSDFGAAEARRVHELMSALVESGHYRHCPWKADIILFASSRWCQPACRLAVWPFPLGRAASSFQDTARPAPVAEERVLPPCWSAVMVAPKQMNKRSSSSAVPVRCSRRIAQMSGALAQDRRLGRLPSQPH